MKRSFLGEIFDIARGASPRPIDEHLTDDASGVPWIMIGDASAGAKYICGTKKRICATSERLSRTVEPGDFLLTNSMSFGHPYITQIRGCIHDGWLVLKPKIDDLDPEFMYHLLGSEQVKRQFQRLASGTTVKNLNCEVVSRVEVSLPPLTEQRRITDILDRTNDLRHKRRQALDLADKFAYSVFRDRFGDKQIPEMSLDECIETFIDYRGKTPAKTSNGIPLVTAKVIKSGRIEQCKEFISERDYLSWMRRGMPEVGDVLFTSEAPLGEVAQVTQRRIALAQRVILLRGRPDLLDNSYLMHALQMPAVRGQILARSTGSTVKGIRQSELRKVTVPVPPLEEQIDFLRIIESVCSIRALTASSIPPSELLSRSLLDALIGEM